MIDFNQWTNTLPVKNVDKDETKYNLDPNKWINTLPKKKNTSIYKNFSITIFIFVIGLIFVSVIKNETRNLQKEINELQASINNLKSDLHLTTLDYEVISSPENISDLAKKHLGFELISYKKSQIKQLKDFEQLLVEKKEIKEESLTSKVKYAVLDNYRKNIKKITKAKKLYKEPEKIPEEIKSTFAKTVQEKKEHIKEIYQNPKGVITSKKIQQWGAIQIVKAFLGIPIVPGK